jgi:hypothetical protein
MLARSLSFHQMLKIQIVVTMDSAQNHVFARGLVHRLSPQQIKPSVVPRLHTEELWNSWIFALILVLEDTVLRMLV